MQINGMSPMHIARAYQMQQASTTRPAARPASAASPTPTAQPTPTQSVRSVHQPQAIAAHTSVQSITPPNQAAMSANVGALVGARVDTPIEFNGTATRQPDGGPALAMYTRAADRIEAGTALHIGQSLDLRG